MCFSAEASFALGGALVIGGVATLRAGRARGPGWTGFASFPLLFGLQQLSEGLLWLSIEAGEASLSAARVFLFFAYFLWPAFVPLSAALVEPDARRQRLFAIVAALGAALGLFLYLPVILSADTLSISLARHSIRYEAVGALPGETLKTAARVVYAAIICLPLLRSSLREIRIFGILITASVALGFAVANHAFTSIWCFLAAGLSFWLWYALRSPRVEPDPSRLRG
ncbi:DUF6629 family protein [Lutimaribacter marinistellae]|uniref:DUF6629 family protein n=1 Tax=Lutimaribacter marinistellae TaxID=1820329 RepID=A0ABV7TF28_9RHOB